MGRAMKGFWYGLTAHIEGPKTTQGMVLGTYCLTIWDPLGLCPPPRLRTCCAWTESSAMCMQLLLRHRRLIESNLYQTLSTLNPKPPEP